MAEDSNSNVREIHQMLGALTAKMDSIINIQAKQFWAMASLVAGTLGLKLLGTPPTVVLLRYGNFLIFTFALTMAIHCRRRVPGWHWIAVYGLCGLVGNLVSILSGEFSWTVTLRIPLFIVANMSVGIFLWHLADHIKLD